MNFLKIFSNILFRRCNQKNRYTYIFSGQNRRQTHTQTSKVSENKTTVSVFIQPFYHYIIRFQVLGLFVNNLLFAICLAFLLFEKLSSKTNLCTEISIVSVTVKSQCEMWKVRFVDTRPLALVLPFFDLLT